MIRNLLGFIILFVQGCSTLEPQQTQEIQPVPHHSVDVDLDIMHNRCVSKGYDEGSEKYIQCIESKDKKHRGKK